MSDEYDCITQKGDEPAFAGSESNIPSIVVGLSTIIPRWTNSTTIKWFIRADKFPSDEEAAIAASALDAAANEWNAVNFGVTVYQTTDKKEANFNLVYRDNPPDRPTVLARAFFPHQEDRDVVVFKYGMDAKNRYRLKNVFLHELGHVFGLRHEFAIVKEGRGAKRFMNENKESVMAYNKIPTVQESDREEIRAFYQLENGADVDGSPVTDYVPQLRSSNQSG
ncbi:matrix metalloproteinase-11 [Fusarium flagelliforme]|uniref:Matrix metalloproteinase-11 n=1 Tax=Fusarium flagelliforme TaxID=2675880 RepID=A0A395MLZ7_9HYPO|nr:matrix metalloproteinase-11 [Fusarium flagelliforme]